MQFDRRTFVKGAGAATAAAAIPGTAAAKPPQAKVDDALDVDAGVQEVVVVFDSNDDVDKLDYFDLPRGYHRFSVLPMGYTVATGDQIQRIATLQSVRRVEANAELEYYNEDAREVTGAAAIQSDRGERGEEAHVVVIDSGISALHPDHQQNLRHNYKYTNPLDRDTMWVDVGNTADTDDNGHGTHVSGSIAGDGTQSGGAQRGMAPEADLTVYSTGVTLAVVNSIGAFDHMLANHTPATADDPEEVAHICSNSYGPTSGNDADFNPDSAINVAAYEAFTQGILVTFAAGNAGPGTNTLSAYAKAPYVLGVAATTDQKTVTDFSSRGRRPGYDGETNYDRDLAMANFLDLQASRNATPKDTESTGQTPSTTGATGGAVVVGLNQTSETFTIEAGDVSFTPDRYELDATLTWSPESPDVEPSDLDLTLLDANGNPVATTGSGGTGTRQEPKKELTAVVEVGKTYQYQITGWRGAAQYEVAGEVVAVEAADDAPNPSGPYGIYRPGVGAPGNLVLSTMSPNDPLQATDTGTESSQMPYYAAISGTSMATPVTSGNAALVVSAHVKEFGRAPDPMTLIDAFESTAQFLPDSKGHTTFNIGRGFVDAGAALDTALSGGQTQSGAGPSVERFDAYDRNSNDQNATIAADYAVSDPDGDLASLTVELSGTDGTSQTRSPSVDGGSASGTVSFDRVTRAGGETYTVTLTVTDDTGATATDGDTVTVAQKGNGGGRSYTPTAGNSFRRA